VVAEDIPASIAPSARIVNVWARPGAGPGCPTRPIGVPP